MGMYYNTTFLSNGELLEALEGVKGQEKRIYKIFKSLPTQSARPSDIHRIYSNIYSTNTPIVSIRRGITNLTVQGKLEKTFDKGKGPHGRSEFLWRVVNK